MNFVVYVITCVTPNHFYVGYTQNLEKRIEAHKKGKGARFTIKHGVKSFMVSGKFSSKELAKKIERSVTLTMKRRPGLTVCGAGWSSSI